MTGEELLNAITQVGTSEDEVTRRNLLADISAEVTTILNSNETLTSENKRFRTDNDNLRSANMQLFLRVSGGNVEPSKTKEEKEEKREYKNLFNEKGELK